MPVDGVPDADHAAGDDVGAQAATVNQASSRSLPRQGLKMSAGLAEPHSAQRDLADRERAPDEMIERDPSRDDVPATVSRTESDVVLALERFERLGLDERDLVSRFIGS